LKNFFRTIAPEPQEYSSLADSVKKLANAIQLQADAAIKKAAHLLNIRKQLNEYGEIIFIASERHIYFLINSNTLRATFQKHLEWNTCKRNLLAGRFIYIPVCI
jgi:hypothetical protein